MSLSDIFSRYPNFRDFIVDHVAQDHVYVTEFMIYFSVPQDKLKGKSLTEQASIILDHIGPLSSKEFAKKCKEMGFHHLQNAIEKEWYQLPVYSKHGLKFVE